MNFELRKDGWPLCPKCGEDELGVTACGFAFSDLVAKHKPACPPMVDLLRFDLYCYKCARFVWWASDIDKIGSFTIVAPGLGPITVEVK